jgi:hypothetical protein
MNVLRTPDERIATLPDVEFGDGGPVIMIVSTRVNL